MRTVHKIRLFVAGCFIILALVLAFYLYIEYRAGKDYTRDLARILPGDTIAYITINDLDYLIDKVRYSDYVNEWVENGSIDNLIRDTDRWKEWEKQKKKYKYLLPYDTELEFIRRWLGRQLIAALVNDDEGTTRPGIIIASKTRMGFEEKLAAFIIEYYPELQLQKERYRGKTIVRYEGEEEKRGFTYTLFGRTVVLSLRSPSPTYVQKIVNTWLEEEENSLWDTPEFQAGLKGARIAEGLFGYLDIKRFPPLFTRFKEDIRPKDTRRREAAATIVRGFSSGYLHWKPHDERIQLEIRLDIDSTVPVAVTLAENDISEFSADMPLAPGESLAWSACSLDAERIRAIVSLAMEDKDDEDERENVEKGQSLSREAVLTILENMPAHINAGMAIADPDRDTGTQGFLATLLVEPALSMVSSSRRPSRLLLEIMNNLVQAPAQRWKPDPDNVSLPTDTIDWWQWDELDYMRAATTDNSMALFMPPRKYTEIMSSYYKHEQRTQQSSQSASIIPEEFLDEGTTRVQCYTQVNLGKISDTIRNIIMLIRFISDKDEVAFEEQETWTGFMGVFQSARLAIYSTASNSVKCKLLLDVAE